MLKNKTDLVAFSPNILVSLWTFQPKPLNERTHTLKNVQKNKENNVRIWWGDWLILRHVNLSKFILCLEVRETRTIIFTFFVLLFHESFF